MDTAQEIARKAEQIETVIKKYLPREEGTQKLVIEAMNYSVLAGGKRLRPMLMQETYRLFGGKSQVVEPFMAAIEMVHTYSLVHDDLPAMDNDEYRRGKKTTHAVYGEAFGILAGDGLLNYAFETALAAFEIEPENRNIIRALRVLAGKAGIYGMIGGQTVDIACSETAPEEETLLFIYRLKTGALLEAAMVVGAALAGATRNEQKQVEQVARDLGMAFQIQDDILDVTGSQEVLGKPIGSDEKNQKTTYVTLFGLEKAKEEVKTLSEQAVSGLDGLVVKNEFLVRLMRYLIHREK